MAWLTQLLRPNIWINQSLNGFASVRCANPRCATMPQQIHTHRKRRFMGGRVLVHHHLNAQGLTAFLQHRNTDQSAAFRCHEIHQFGRHVSCSREKIALVLPIFIVNNFHNPSRIVFIIGFFDCI